jgi:hypothetical protein
MNDDIMIKVLECINKADGLIGRGGIYKLLQGQYSRKFAKYGLDHIPEFGSLSHISNSEILELSVHLCYIFGD